MGPSPRCRRSNNESKYMFEIENLRLKYKPTSVEILFVGESAPAGGTFFYNADSILFRNTYEAFVKTVGKDFESNTVFLNFFKESGYYLDDLCLTPINHWDKKAKEKMREEGINPLSKRIRAYQPKTIIVVMKAIESHVLKAVEIAGLDVQFKTLPFPAQGWQREYVFNLIDVIQHIHVKSVNNFPIQVKDHLVNQIIRYLDLHLEETGATFLNPVEANALLDDAGLLKDSHHRPGKPLRDILRSGLIPYAYQSTGGKNGRWIIPHS